MTRFRYATNACLVLLLAAASALAGCPPAARDVDDSELTAMHDAAVTVPVALADASTEAAIALPAPSADAALVQEAGPSEAAVALPHADGSVQPSMPDAGAQDPAEFNGDIALVGMGEAVGGFPVPIWLYKGGLAIAGNDAPLPVKALAAAHYKANPDLWFHWRRGANGLEIKQQREWHGLEYDEEFGPYPANRALTGTFEGLNNTYKTTKYRFSAGGRFEYCEYIGIITSGSRWSGSYDVADFVIDLESGSELDRYSFVYDPVERPNTLWIDGTPFKRDNDADTFAALSCP